MPAKDWVMMQEKMSENPTVLMESMNFEAFNRMNTDLQNFYNPLLLKNISVSNEMEQSEIRRRNIEEMICSQQAYNFTDYNSCQ